MKISAERLKEIIKEELGHDEMFSSNEATDLRSLYNKFVDSIPKDVINMNLRDLDEQNRDKIEQIEIIFKDNKAYEELEYLDKLTLKFIVGINIDYPFRAIA